ncbi:MAG: hypothetical protein K2U26_03645 [Cyclobacteriaceae bacterium]|nr:hypothetical protein [Cyclobacteriaceae bacterium]
MKHIKRFVSYTLFFYATTALIYWIFIRPLHLSWGATFKEINKAMPADSLISPNRVVTTRAINIQAPRERAWPWIAQTGQNKGGFNSYHWLENLFGASMVNADSIVRQWQHPVPGDTIYYGKHQGYQTISLVKPNECYSLGGWSFYLHAIDSGNTRLIIRYPSMEVGQSRWTSIYYYGLFEPLHFIMESGMMMGIKHKAERQK